MGCSALPASSCLLPFAAVACSSVLHAASRIASPGSCPQRHFALGPPFSLRRVVLSNLIPTLPTSTSTSSSRKPPTVLAQHAENIANRSRGPPASTAGPSTPGQDATSTSAHASCPHIRRQGCPGPSDGRVHLRRHSEAVEQADWRLRRAGRGNCHHRDRQGAPYRPAPTRTTTRAMTTCLTRLADHLLARSMLPSTLPRLELSRSFSSMRRTLSPSDKTSSGWSWAVRLPRARRSQSPRTTAPRPKRSPKPSPPQNRSLKRRKASLRRRRPRLKRRTPLRPPSLPRRPAIRARHWATVKSAASR